MPDPKRFTMKEAVRHERTIACIKRRGTHLGIYLSRATGAFRLRDIKRRSQPTPHAPLSGVSIEESIKRFWPDAELMTLPEIPLATTTKDNGEQ